VNPLRSVGARLSLALLLVLVGALSFVYLFVIPSLENRLVDAKLSQLSGAAPRLARELPENQFRWDDFAETASASANARVVVFTVLGPPTVLRVAADSRSARLSTDVEQDAIALRAALSDGRASGTVTRERQRLAEVAVPASGGPILLLSASLHDSLGNVDLVRRRLLGAGALALLMSLVIGYGGAWAFARRLRRLEHAAERIATGRFDEPVIDTGADEVGQLARAFERMRQRLAQLDHARKEFIANASHELRTPLFSLGGFLELLTDEELDEKNRREFLETMAEQVRRLTKLATELLDLSRLDAGQLRVQREPLSLTEAARTVAGEFQAVAQTAAHPLEVVEGDDPIALGDEERVLQIGRILVENALVHTPPGTTVRLRAGSANGSAILAVEDDGPGIASAHAAHVFERFYRVDGAQASGSGLGLSIARELAELMGGSLALDSRPGRTVLTLELPGAEKTRENGAAQLATDRAFAD
jgi:signal transduction histidine kinase